MLAPKAVHILAFGAGNFNQTDRLDYHAIMDNVLANLTSLEETIRKSMGEKEAQNKEADEDKIDERMKNLRFGASITEDGEVTYHIRMERPDKGQAPLEASAGNTSDLLIALAQRLSE